MKIEYKKIDDLIPYANNPRFNDEAVEYVANSIKNFGFKVPIIIDKNNEIVAGHTRYKASLELGFEEVPCIIADDLDDEKIKAFRLADNKVSEKAELWNYELLDEELSDILELDMTDYGFLEKIESENDEVLDNAYTKKIDIPSYDITGEEPEIRDLYDDYKAKEMMKKIEDSNVSEEQKEFLRKATTRLYSFNYSNIAEYYAHQDKEMQELMEDLILVIVDINKAISNGYVQLSQTIEDIISEE